MTDVLRPSDPQRGRMLTRAVVCLLALALAGVAFAVPGVAPDAVMPGPGGPEAGAPPTELGGWLHTLDPFLWRITPGFGLRWYGMSYLAGFVLGALLLLWLAQRGAVLIPPAFVLDAVVALVVGVMLGGRLGYCLFYQPSLFTTFSGDLPFWGVLMINRGGMASHGGMIGVAVACWWVSRGFRTATGERVGRAPLLHIADAACLVAPVGLGLGRLANFINGELLGRVLAPAGQPAPWYAVRYPQELTERFAGVPDSWADNTTPEQQQRMVDLLSQFAAPDDRTLEQAAPRLIDALHSGPPDVRQALAEQIEPLLTARAPSQLLQALAEGLALIVVLWLVARRPRTPGVIGAWFLIVYGVGRVLTEFVRLPDSHLGASATTLGLSRGQWLSVLMVLAGGAMLAVLARSKAPKLGGWAGPRPSPPTGVTPSPAFDTPSPAAKDADRA